MLKRGFVMHFMHRAAGMLLAVVFVLSGLISGTQGWQNLSQQAKNEVQSDIIRQVELHKLEKLPDGTETKIPVPGAAFYLFTENGTQLGGRYVTDSEGKILLSLEPGGYYFEESDPAPGFTFDKDENGNRVTRYPFTVTGVAAEAVVVTACNVRLQGALTIEKEVRNADGSDLTEAQKLQMFIFTVTFSDSGTYECRIDGGEPQQIASGGYLMLTHGRQAVFDGLPVGVTYTVTEQPTPDYTVSGTGHTGTITPTGSAAYFVNTYAPPEPDTIEIAGTKTWDHGDNPNRPESIIVYVYADGELAARRPVTEKDNWQYAFTLPRFAPDGHKINYTVGEMEVRDYTAEIHGYDIHNTYTGTAPGPDPGSPQTGDNTNIWPWVAVMIVCMLGVIVLLTMNRTARLRK